MTLVIDASLLVAALTNFDSDGAWARRTIQSDSLAACHHLPLEVANVLRRMELAGEISPDIITIAHAEMFATSIELHPYQPFANRVWQLRHSVTIHDAWYVALAETLEAQLATLDSRLTRAPGPRCQFLTPPAPP